MPNISRKLLTLACMVFGLCGCGKHADRNVFGNASADQLLSRCKTGNDVTVALYINEAGGAAVGTSWSVTTEHKPMLVERQIIYSEDPAILSLVCTSRGFDLTTSNGPMHFTDGDADTLRMTPKDLGEQYQRARAVKP